MARIRTLHPNVAKEEAMAEFARVPAIAVRNALFGSLQSVAEFYIPFRFFQVDSDGRERRSRIFGIDVVTGELDPYEFEDLPEPEDIAYVETRNCPPILLDEPRARELLLKKLRRRTFLGGLLGAGKLQVSAEAIPGEIYIPYWVGLRGQGVRARIAVMDAMRRQMEGGKLRHLLRQCLGSITVKS